MREMVISAREDNDIRLDLIRCFEPLIKKCIKIYVRNYDYYEDAMQDGYLTILKCIEMYDENSKCEFPAYVKMAMHHNIRDFSRKIKNDISLDDEINDDGGTLLDVLPGDTNVEESEIKKDEIKAMYEGIERLTKKQREIILEVFFKNLSMREVCKNKRCHYMTVVRLKDRALESLRGELEFYKK